MNFLSKIKDRISIFYLKWIKFELIEYKFLDISKNEKLIKYVEKIALELAEKENLPVFNVSFDELNKELKIEDDDKKAAAAFRYISKENINTYYNLIKNYDVKNMKTPEAKKFLSLPRIEMTEQGDVFILIHELGHYFIYKRDQIQSEDAADAYCEEFFNEHLPSFFKWIFQINIYVRTQKNIKYSSLESYNYFKEYKQWIKNNPDFFE